MKKEMIKEMERVMRKEVKTKAFLVVLLIGILLTIDVFSASAFGQCPEDLYYWVVSSGNWATPDNWQHEEWDPVLGHCVPVPGVPGSADTVFIENGGTATISSVTFAESAFVQNNSSVLSVVGGGSLAISKLLRVDWDGLFQQSGGQTSAICETVGHRGTGRFIQTGGTNMIPDCLFIGQDASSNGTYELVEGELSAFEEEIGDNGTGKFIQTGGTNTVFGQGIPSGLSLGRGVGSVGRYELINGTVVADEIFMGRRGKGTFVQSGGKVTVNELFVGPDPGSQGLWCNGIGRYELHGGTIDVEEYVCIGAKGMGSFIMVGDGGTIKATGNDADLTVFGTGSLTGPGTFNIEVNYQSEEIYGTGGDQPVDVIFGRYDLYKGGAYNVDQLTPADFAGGTVANLLPSSVFDVSFGGNFSVGFKIAIPYDEADIADLDENNMRLHVLYETGPETYERLEGVQIDRTENVVYGQAHSFGKFAISGDPFLIFNVTQPPVYNICQLDPALLTLNTIDGSVIHTWKCFSGANVVYNWELMINNSRFARWKYLGPIPPGVWRVGLRGSRNGKNQYPLYPVFGTETFDRDKFYIHGTADLELCPDYVGASQGCIVIMPGQYESTFVHQFENAPNVLDALIQRQLLLYVENFPPDKYPPVLYYVRYILHSPANLFLQTEFGHVCGYDPELGEVVNDIDGATYSGPGTDPQILTYPLFSTVPVDDHLTLIPVGAGGPYELEVRYQQLDGSVVTAQQTGQVLPGEPVDYFVTLAPDAISLFPSEPATIPATIDFDPDTLNLKSQGKLITCYIELPEGYDVDEIDVGSILLEHLLEVQHRDVQDDVLMVKFERKDVIAYIAIVLEIELPADVTLMVTGELTDGTPFEGSDTIRVIDEGKNKESKGMNRKSKGKNKK